MENKAIFRKILPFLFLFIFSLGIAGNEYVKQISAPTNAADDDVKVEIANTSGDLAKTNTAKWNVLTYVGNYFKNPVNLTYEIYSCDVLLNKEGVPGDNNKLPCDPKIVGSNYLATAKSGTLSITSRESTQIISQPDFTCGKMTLVIKRNGVVLARQEQSKNSTCTKQGLDANNSDLGIGDLISRIARVVFSDDDSEDGGNSSDTPTVIPPGEKGQIIPPTSDPGANQGIELYNFIVKNCNGTVDSLAHCLFNAPAQPELIRGADVIAQLYKDIRALGLPMQCVAFARAAMFAAYGYTFPSVGSPKAGMQHDLNVIDPKTGKAGPGKLKYTKNPCQGIPTFPCQLPNPPQPGDLAIYDNGTWGHVGFITEVKGDTIIVIDANFGGGAGGVAKTPWALNNKILAGWQHYIP